MESNKILIKTDFNNDYIGNHLKSFKSLKNVKISLKNFENFLASKNEFTLNKSNNQSLFLITQVNKLFNLDEILLIEEKKRKKEVDKLILEIQDLISTFSSIYKKITFFLWPYDTNDNYLNELNFKKTGKNWLINYINLQTSDKLSQFQNVSIIDPNFKLLQQKKDINIYDEKTKYLIGNHYSLDYLEFCSKEVENTILNEDIKKIKLIILDLDNTLWGGEAGERPYKDLEIGPDSVKGLVFYDFQLRLKNLKNYGYILAICSKNELKNVKKVFQKNKHMVLNLKDFSSIKVNWKNKNENIKEILTELNLRAENTLFVDDNEYERNIVKSDLKGINVFEYPKNVLLLNENFNKLQSISKNSISDTDKQRTKLYLDEKKRESQKKKYFDHKDWLSSLKIKIKINDLENFKRAEEMYLRTNQFNISHKPLSSEQIKSLIKKKENKFYEVSMSDRFGNYGVIGLLGAKIKEKTFEITDFLESCRVFKRNVEDYLIRFILKKNTFKNKKGYLLINRNKKNIYVQDLFDNCKYLKKINNKTYEIDHNYKFNELNNIKVKIN